MLYVLYLQGFCPVKDKLGGDMAVSDQLKSNIDELVPDMVALCRDLHEHLELAFEKVRTSGIVARRPS